MKPSVTVTVRQSSERVADGRQTRSFCYVDDLIDGLVRLMATGDDVAGPVNLGNPHECTIIELAERPVPRAACHPSSASRRLR